MASHERIVFGQTLNLLLGRMERNFGAYLFHAMSLLQLFDLQSMPLSLHPQLFHFLLNPSKISILIHWHGVEFPSNRFTCVIASLIIGYVIHNSFEVDGRRISSGPEVVARDEIGG